MGEKRWAEMGEKRVSGAKTGMGGRGEDAPTAMGAGREQRDMQGVPNAEVCLTPQPPPHQPHTQPQEWAEKPGAGTAGRSGQGEAAQLYAGG